VARKSLGQLVCSKLRGIHAAHMIITVTKGLVDTMADPKEILKAGTEAPDFTLSSAPDETITLSDLRGQPVILAFYPADWSPTCSDQMGLYNEVLDMFEEHGAKLLGISVDSRWCHKAFKENRGLRFDLLADFEPKGEVARRYGVYNDEKGTSDRALFVVDPDGVISWSYLSPRSVNPGADGILQALEDLERV
jgi:peroxiredoxin